MRLYGECLAPERGSPEASPNPGPSLRGWRIPILSAAVDDTFLGRAIQLALLTGNMVAADGAAPRGPLDPVGMAVGDARLRGGAVIPGDGSLAPLPADRDQGDTRDGNHCDDKDHPGRGSHDGSPPVEGRLMAPMIVLGA
jgi:hypothetical protein